MEKVSAKLPTPFEDKTTSTFVNSPVYRKALESLPQADLDLVKSRGTTLSDEVIAAALVKNRWNNKICDTCGEKSKPQKLKHCARCCLAFYCDISCQKSGWKEHKKRCAKKDGPLDTGYQAIVFHSSEILDMDPSDKKDAQPGQEIRFEGRTKPETAEFFKLTGSAAKDKEEMDKHFEDPKLISQLIKNGEQNNLFEGTLASRIEAQKILVLIFPSIAAILRTLKNDWKQTPQQSREEYLALVAEDKCCVMVWTKSKGMRDFPTSTILSNLTTDQWGLVIATPVRLKKENEQTYVERIIAHQICSYGLPENSSSS